MATYKIIRFYQNGEKSRRVIKRGLTLTQAQAHCKDPETSSSTCKSAAGKARTRRHGPWFDGYEEERAAQDNGCPELEKLLRF